MPSVSKIKGISSAYIPPSEPGPDRLLVVMHGLGDSLEGYRFLPDILKIPGLHYLLVNAPDTYFTGFSWFDIYGQMEPGILRSRELLFRILGELEGQGWDPKHVGVFGFSQGCLMALDIGCRYPKVLGAVIGISGFVGFMEQYPEAFSPVARQQKFLVTHGTHDPLLPLEPTQQQIEGLKGMGLKVEFKVYRKEHTIEPYDEVQDIRAFLLKTLSSGR